MVKIKYTEKTKDSLLGGAFALTLSVIIVKIIGFIYKMPLSHILSDEGMGYFNSAYSVFAFFYMLCTSGVPRAVSITVTEAMAKGEEDTVNKILGISLKVYVIIGVIFSTLLMLFSSFFADMIGNSLSSFSLFCIAPSLTFVSASGVLRGYLNGHRRMRDIAISEVIEGVIKFVFGLSFALIAARKRLPVHMISAFTVLGVTLGTFVGVVFLLICTKNAKVIEKYEQKCECVAKGSYLLKKVFRISLPITLSSAIMGMTNIIDLGLIMKRLLSFGISSSEAIALYGNFTTLAVPMLNLVIALITPLGTASIPHLTAKFASGDQTEFNEICQSVLMLSAVICFPAFAGYLFFSKDILVLLFNDTSAMVGAPLLSLLSASVIPLCLLTVINSILESVFYQRVSLMSMSIGAVIKLISAYYLIGKYGIIGAPISTGIGYSVSFLISSIYLICGVKIKLELLGIIFVPFASSFISIGTAFIMYNYLTHGNSNPKIFLVFAALSALFYLVLICIFMQKKLISVCKFVKIAKN